MYPHHPLADERSIGPLTFILNILWLILGGAVAGTGLVCSSVDHGDYDHRPTMVKGGV